MLAGDDMDVGQLQILGFLSLAVMVVLVAPAAVVTLVGEATHLAGLQWAGIGLGMLKGRGSRPSSKQERR